MNEVKEAFYILKVYQRVLLIFLILCLLASHLIRIGLHPLFGLIAPTIGCALTVIISSVKTPLEFIWKDKGMWKFISILLYFCFMYFYGSYMPILLFPINGNIILPSENLLFLLGWPIILLSLIFHIGTGVIIRKTKYFL